jgi:hypothetical protein
MPTKEWLREHFIYDGERINLARVSCAAMPAAWENGWQLYLHML